MTFPCFAGKNVAIVKIIKGEVNYLTLGSTKKLNKDDWVQEGSVIKTAEKSFVKLVFVDKSQMNIGPNSEMKIETFNGKEAGVIDLVKGKIRSQVTKDYLEMENKEQSKMYIKTTNAVMGVRGTDFMIATNGKVSSVVLFEGEIAFGTLTSSTRHSRPQLERIVNNGVKIFPGEFSVIENRRAPTIPSYLNAKQKEVLEKSDDFGAGRAPASQKRSAQNIKSIIPKGLTGAIVAKGTNPLLSDVKEAISTANDSKNDTSRSSSNPEGYVNGERVKPANGSFLHVDSGIIFPPSADSKLDTTSNTYIDSGAEVKVDEFGNFIPPENIKITRDGKIVATVSEGPNNNQQIELRKPIPIMSDGFEDSLDRQDSFFGNQSSFQQLENIKKDDSLKNSSANDIRIQNQVENIRRTTTTTIRVRSDN